VQTRTRRTLEQSSLLLQSLSPAEIRGALAAQQEAGLGVVLGLGEGQAIRLARCREAAWLMAVALGHGKTPSGWPLPPDGG